MSATLSDWANYGTIAAGIAAVGALLYAARQVRLGAAISRAQFWLELRKMFAEHREVHLKLRNEEWPTSDDNFPGEADWLALESYMGLFEHCQFMLDDKLIDWNTFYKIYGYRLKLIVNNPLIIREKIINRRNGWEVFIRLLAKMAKELPQQRYLSGIWMDKEGRGKLWLGCVHQQEVYLEFTDWARLESRYHEVLRQIVNSVDKPAHAWLRKNWDTVHEWPAPNDETKVVARRPQNA